MPQSSGKPDPVREDNRTILAEIRQLVRESERTGFDIDSFFTGTAERKEGRDRRPGAAMRQRYALLDFLAKLPDKVKSEEQPIQRSKAAWIWDAEALTESLDSAMQFTGSFLEVDAATADRLREIAEKKSLRPQEVAWDILRDGIEKEEIHQAPSVGIYWDILVQQGAYYISELHDFDALPGEPEDFHFLQDLNGKLLKAWTVVEELKDGTWQEYQHGLGHTGFQKRQRHCYEEITREEAVRLIHENAIPQFFQADFVRNSDGKTNSCVLFAGEVEESFAQTKAFIALVMDYIIRFDQGESHIFEGNVAAGLIQLEGSTVERLENALSARHIQARPLPGRRAAAQ